jgi:histidinol-phosphate aminotransferase
MSPTPVTFTSPVAPSTYAWEATNEEVARRYGIPLDRVVRFDLNTSPQPPELVAGILASGHFQTPLSEYPPSDYGELTVAAAARYGVATEELLVGAGADEILDLVAKAFIPPGGRAVIPTPTYSMYRVLTEQRGGVIVEVPRQAAGQGWALDPIAVRRAARQAAIVWLCSPNNPTCLAEPDGIIAALLDGLDADTRAAGRDRPIVVLDEAYAEFTGESHAGLRHGYPELIVVRTLSKAYGLAGLRVGFAIARPETIARVARYRPPGSVSTVSVTVATRVLLEPDVAHANLERVEAERPRLIEAVRSLGLEVGPSATNFILVGLGSPGRAALVAEQLMRQGLVPRTFGAGHPLADRLRVTIRDRADDDRLIDALRGILSDPSLRHPTTSRPPDAGTPAAEDPR